MAMVQPLSTLKPEIAALRPRHALPPAVLWGGGGVAALLLLAGAGLWFHYGTAVFFETVAVGFANCF